MRVVEGSPKKIVHIIMGFWYHDKALLCFQCFKRAL